MDRDSIAPIYHSTGGCKNWWWSICLILCFHLTHHKLNERERRICKNRYNNTESHEQGFVFVRIKLSSLNTVVMPSLYSNVIFLFHEASCKSISKLSLSSYARYISFTILPFSLFSSSAASHRHKIHACKRHAVSMAAPTNSCLPAALVGEEPEAEPVAEGVPVPVPVPDAELVVAAAESVPLAFVDLPVYFVVVTPLPLVHWEAVELVLEKVMSAHCASSLLEICND